VKITLIILLLVAIFGIPGSHYKIRTSLPPYRAKIAIPVFVNRSFKENLGDILTGKVIDQFMLRTRFQIVPEDEADFILRGKVLNYTKQLTSVEFSETGEYRIEVEVEASLYKRKNKLWRKTITESKVYYSSSQNEQKAIEDVCQKIGEDLVNLTIKGWKK